MNIITRLLLLLIAAWLLQHNLHLLTGKPLAFWPVYGCCVAAWIILDLSHANRETWQELITQAIRDSK